MTFLHYLRTSPQRGREKCAHMEDVHGIMQMTFHHLKKNVVMEKCNPNWRRWRRVCVVQVKFSVHPPP
jgi:hypothetical protein